LLQTEDKVLGCIVKSLFKGNKFQYTTTNQPQYIKYKQYKASAEGMQAHYKYSLHMCPSARASVPRFAKISFPPFKTPMLGGHINQTVGTENSILKSQDKHSHRIDKD